MKIIRRFSPTKLELEPLKENFHRFVTSTMPELPGENEDKTFLFTCNEDDRLLAGIFGSYYWDGLEIDTLWVSAELRGKGIGTDLVYAAETWAREHGAVVSHLKTVEATAFYKKLGYSIFGVLEDRPIGTTLYYMKKRLDSRA